MYLHDTPGYYKEKDQALSVIDKAHCIILVYDISDTFTIDDTIMQFWLPGRYSLI